MAKGLRVLSKGIDYKCGGCNWESSTAWYLEGEPEPELDPKEGDGSDRLANGLCSGCFLEMLEQGGYLVSLPGGKGSAG